MSVKDHYENHLGNFYSWMTGDFNQRKNEFLEFCRTHNIKPERTAQALDLGAGHGIQTAALAEQGFFVTAVDFCSELLEELRKNTAPDSVKTVCDDICNIAAFEKNKYELVVCCGDTISHLESADQCRQLIQNCYDIMIPGGKLLVSFRDYSKALEDSARFIQVKSDSARILTCFLEYFENQVRVTDILHENMNSEWHMKLSSYYKIRLSHDITADYLTQAGFKILFDGIHNRMISIIVKK